MEYLTDVQISKTKLVSQNIWGNYRKCSKITDVCSIEGLSPFRTAGFKLI